MSYEIQIRRAAEMDITDAQVWYESQQIGLGGEFRTEISQILDHLTATPFVYQRAHAKFVAQ